MTTADSHDLQHTGRTIRAEMRTTADAHAVWSAWTDPASLSAWFTDGAEGAPVVGSTFKWIWEEMGMVQPFEVVAADPDRRFALAMEVPGHGLGVVEVLIEQDGGETVMRLINSGFREDAEFDDEYEGVVSGWSMALGALKHYLEHHAGKPRRGFMVMRTGEFEFSDVIPFHRTEAGLARWLTTSGEPGAAGTPVSLQLQDGGALTGTVLARTKWETALSWDELSAVLELKAFSCGPAGRAIGVRVSAWGLDEAAAAELRARLEAALDRLAAAMGL